MQKRCISKGLFQYKDVVLSVEWNLDKATTELCGLSMQVVFHDRENKHDIVKTVPGKLQTFLFLVRLSWALVQYKDDILSV